MSKVPVSYIMRGLKPILLILIFTFALNMFMVDGRILWQWKFLKITAEGLEVAVFMAIRLVLLLMGSSKSWYSGYWKTSPILLRISTIEMPEAVISVSPIRMVPSSGFKSPLRCCKRVDLPEPV